MVGDSLEERVVAISNPRDHNEARPIHSIPAELFLDILLATVDSELPLFPQLHTLTQVCRYWFHSIISESRFWRVIDLDARNLAPIVIKRNPDGPLSIRCRFEQALAASENSIDNFRELAREQAHRWTVLELSGVVDGRGSILLNNTTPALLDLKIIHHSPRGSSFFQLSTTSKLRHVDVWNIRLPWDSQSLAGLKSISIACPLSGDPSLRQIVTILSASPALEWFALNHITDISNIEDGHTLPDCAIQLPALCGLYLTEQISPWITLHLLKNIVAPKCRIMETFVPFSLLQHPGPTFQKLPHIPMQVANTIHVDYSARDMDITISSATLWERVRDGWRCDNDGARLCLTVGGIPYSPGVEESVVQFLSVPIHSAEVSLVLHDGDVGIDPAHSFFNHLAFWKLATSLTLSGSYGPRTLAALQFLSTPTTENGHTRWPCPRLISVYVVTVDNEEFADPVVEFLERRSPERADVGSTKAVLHMPAPIEFMQGDKEFFDLIRKSKAVEGIHMWVNPGNP